MPKVATIAVSELVDFFSIGLSTENKSKEFCMR